MADQKTSIVISAEDRTQAALASVQRGMAGLTQSFSGLDAIAGRIPAIGGAIAAAFGGVSLTGIVKGTIDYAASLNDLAQQTGATVEQLSSLRNVAELNDVSLDEAGKAMQRLAKNMADAARGTKEQVDTFAALGVAFKDGNGQLRESGSVLVDVAKAIAGLESPTERVAAAQLAFGKSGAALVPMLLDLAQNGLENAKVTDEQAAAADRFGDALTRLGQRLRDAGQGVALELAPSLERLAINFEAAEKAGLGFFQTITGFGVRGLGESLGDAFANAGPRLNELRAELARLEADKANLEFGDFYGEQAANNDIRRVNQLIEYYKKLQLESVKSDPSNLDARDRQLLEQRRGSLAAALAGSDAGSKTKAGKAETEAARKQRYDALDGDGRSAKEIMAELRAEDRAIENLRQKYIDLADPLQKYRDQLDEIQKLRADGILTADQATAAEWSVNQSLDAAIDKMEQLGETTNETDSFARDFGLSFTSAFEDIIVKGGDVRDALRAIGEDIARIVVRKKVTEPLGNSVSKLVEGIDFGNIFGGFRAEGGPVSAGKFYVVGERGPEILMPGSSGHIVPNDAISGTGTGTTNHFNVDMRGASVDAVARLEQLVMQVNGSIERRAIGVMKQAGVRGI